MSVGHFVNTYELFVILWKKPGLSSCYKMQIDKHFTLLLIFFHCSVHYIQQAVFMKTHISSLDDQLKTALLKES